MILTASSGINPIQDHAIRVSNMLLWTKSYEQYVNPVWSIEENVELMTRAWVREDIASLLSDVDNDTVEALKDVLFNVVYPTYKQPIEK